jgi:hypothetical protein
VLAPDRKLVTDGVHPTAEGYSRIAELFRDAVASLESVPESAIPRRSGSDLGLPSRKQDVSFDHLSSILTEPMTFFSKSHQSPSRLAYVGLPLMKTPFVFGTL